MLKAWSFTACSCIPGVIPALNAGPSHSTSVILPGGRPSLSSSPSPRCCGMVLHSRRSEEHTSELQSHLNIVCRLLLEKKKQTNRRSARAVYIPSMARRQSAQPGFADCLPLSHLPVATLHIPLVGMLAQARRRPLRHSP